MVVGYVILGGLSGLVAAALHLNHGSGSILAAIGVFYLACFLTILLTALWVVLRTVQEERRGHSRALTAPVPPLQRPGPSMTRTMQHSK